MTTKTTHASMAPTSPLLNPFFSVLAWAVSDIIDGVGTL